MPRTISLRSLCNAKLHSCHLCLPISFPQIKVCDPSKCRHFNKCACINLDVHHLVQANQVQALTHENTNSTQLHIMDFLFLFLQNYSNLMSTDRHRTLLTLTRLAWGYKLVLMKINFLLGQESFVSGGLKLLIFFPLTYSGGHEIKCDGVGGGPRNEIPSRRGGKENT